jgi:hypothetical protein
VQASTEATWGRRGRYQDRGAPREWSVSERGSGASTLSRPDVWQRLSLGDCAWTLRSAMMPADVADFLSLACQKNSTTFLTLHGGLMPAQSISATILRRMRASRDAVFSAKDFLDLGSRAAADQALARAARDGIIRRVGRGLYDIPRKSSLVGDRSPRLDSVAMTVVRKSGARIGPTGAQAANMFGLTTQVPAQARYLTDRTGRTLQIGKQSVRLLRVAPRRLAGDPVSQAVIEGAALRRQGPHHRDGRPANPPCSLATRQAGAARECPPCAGLDAPVPERDRRWDDGGRRRHRPAVG